MPPNLKGGKNYKKKAKGVEIDYSTLQIDREADQQVARVIKILGNRNMLCYCNDDKQRICRVCGKMRNRTYVELGDFVIVSLREFEEGASKSHDALRGDIIQKYPMEYLSKLRKEAGVNPKLFMLLDSLSGANTGKGSGTHGDDLFDVFDRDESTENKIEDTGAPAGTESGSDEELDIDAI